MKCFACDRALGRHPHTADTHEDQFVSVGSECFKLITSSGVSGYQPPKGGPRLFTLSPERKQYFLDKGLM